MLFVYLFASRILHNNQGWEKNKKKKQNLSAKISNEKRKNNKKDLNEINNKKKKTRPGVAAWEWTESNRVRLKDLWRIPKNTIQINNKMLLLFLFLLLLYYLSYAQE